ncbi:MAG: hypothetical protein ACOCPX_01695 [Halapricum sp.]
MAHGGPAHPNHAGHQRERTFEDAAPVAVPVPWPPLAVVLGG